MLGSLGLTLRLARGTAGRLVLAGVAVALGAGFVAAVLLTSALFTRTAQAAVSAEYAGADVVVTQGDSGFSDADVIRVAAADGVSAAEGRVSSGVQLVGAARSQYASLESTSAVPELARWAAQDGRLPQARGQVALTDSTAERLGVGVGDQLRVRTYPAPPADSGGGVDPDAPWEPVDVPVSVVGLLAGGFDSPLGSSGSVLAVPADALAWSTSGSGAAPGYGTVLAVAAPGTSAQQARDAVTAALAGIPGSPAVQTADERTSEAVDEFTGGTAVLTGVALAFAVVALFVAATVITNTFSVLVARRTRQLALLRCVGATSSQVRRSVLAEAALLGLVASVVGVLGGTALAAVAAAVLSRAADGLALPSTVVVTPWAVVAPVVVGVLATLAAASAPARAATRVSPLAALRPAGVPDLRRAGSRLRLAVSSVLVLGGLALLLGGTLLAVGTGAELVGAVTGTSDELTRLGLPVAILGGLASFTGVLVGAVFLVPRVVALVGRLASAATGGAPARLATLNAVRNPRRTASTTSALLIGTALVALMVVGAATTSRTLTAALDRQFPVDATVTAVATSPDGGTSAGAGVQERAVLDPAVVSAATGVQGVAASAELLTAEVTTHGGDGMSPRGETYGLDLVGGQAAQLADVVTDPSAVDHLAPGTVVVPLETAERLGVGDGDELTLSALDADGGASRDLRVVVSQLGGRQVVVVPADFTALVPGAATGAVWLRFAPDADAATAADDLQTAVSEAAGTSSSPVSVEGLAAERATYEQVIDTMLLVVVGLLAVAVVIALVGVANTLSLSVIERTRENAVLRALGLTRGQLRRTLALEGALVAGVGGLLGVVLGSLYGWAGAASLLGGVAAVGGDAVWTPALPWGRLGLLLAVAVVAGLLASVLPARRAVRTPPVAALADQ